MSLTNATLAQHATRERLKKRAIETLRTSLNAVPQLGSVATMFRHDYNALDAILTLSALGHSPESVVTFVNRERLGIETYLNCLTIAVSKELLSFLDVASSRN